MRKFSKAHTQVAAPGADDDMTTQRERVEEKGVRLSAAAAVQVLACGVQQRVCGVHHGWIAGPGGVWCRVGFSCATHTYFRLLHKLAWQMNCRFITAEG